MMESYNQLNDVMDQNPEIFPPAMNFGELELMFLIKFKQKANNLILRKLFNSIAMFLLLSLAHLRMNKITMKIRELPKKGMAKEIYQERQEEIMIGWKDEVNFIVSI